MEGNINSEVDVSDLDFGNLEGNLDSDEEKQDKAENQDKIDKKRFRDCFFDNVRKSPINYFSDLFIVLMVTAWIITIIIMICVAVYATVRFGDTSIWTNIENLVTVPLASGGAIWMIKCSIQHAIAGNKGKKCPSDFPKVENTEIEMEEIE